MRKWACGTAGEADRFRKEPETAGADMAITLQPSSDLDRDDIAVAKHLPELLYQSAAAHA
jgi:hypothetical protein